MKNVIDLLTQWQTIVHRKITEDQLLLENLDLDIYQANELFLDCIAHDIEITRTRLQQHLKLALDISVAIAILEKPA